MPRIGAVTAWVLAAIATIAAAHAVPANAQVSGGTVLANTASATYSDPRGKTYGTESNPVQLTVAKIAAILVTPKQVAVNTKTDAYIAGQPIVRTYTIANDSDIPDAYTIEGVGTDVRRAGGASAARAVVQSIAFVTPSGDIPVTIGSTVSPTVAPGGSIAVRVDLSTTGIPAGTAFAIRLRARTTAAASNGLQSDTGQTWALAIAPPKLTGAGGGQISKTVDQVASVQSSANATVQFDIVVKNSGGTTAYALVIRDPVPAGLGALISTAKVNGRPAGAAATLAGRTLTLRWPQLAPGHLIDLSFDAVVENAVGLGETFVNVAYVGADGTTAKATTPASVFIGSGNIVYDGYVGASAPIPGALVTLLGPDGQPVRLPPGQQSDNPMITPNSGAYGFDLSGSAIPAAGARYELTVAASGYLSRRIALEISRGVDGVLYDVTATALDGQPLAAAGGFTLVKHAVALKNVFGLFGNVPMFSSHALNVTKTAGSLIVQPGDRALFTVTVANTFAVPLHDVTVVDQLPPGMIYAPGTARVNGVDVEPLANGQTLRWTFATLAANATLTIEYATVVFPSVAPGTTLTNVVNVKGQGGASGVPTGGTANASLQVVSGALSARGVITGRVFLDLMKTGHFTKGDKGVAGVRIFLEDGTSVTTDAQGRYSFAGVRPGMHVLRVDPSTLPAGVRARTDVPMNSPYALQRLVHGILDEGTIQDVNFALGAGR